MPNPESLQKYPLFESLPEKDLVRLLPHIQKRAFGKGVYLFYPGSPNSQTYLVESGLVRLFFTNAHGKEFFLNLVHSGGIFGLPVLEASQTRLMGASAFQDSVIVSIPCEVLTDNMLTMPLLARNLYREASQSARLLVNHSKRLVTLSLNARLAQTILQVARMWGTAEGMEMPLNQSQFASWLGASRGRLNRALIDLQKQGLIRTEDTFIYLLDKDGLERVGQDE
jgi:CRP/FNR family transcriptional regulator